MRLPFLLSVPHAGLTVPSELRSRCLLTEREILEDGDVGAADIYDLESEVEAHVTTDVARAIVDLNRAPDDRRADGVVKTHTCWSVPVYREPLSEPEVAGLLEGHYHPYHRRLAELATRGDGIRLGIDCHTMAAVGPPVGPDPGRARPRVCLSNAHGTCPKEWMAALERAFLGTFEREVRSNDPFQGGYITRTHSARLPFVQLELSRAPFFSNLEKRAAVVEALRGFWREVG